MRIRLLFLLGLVAWSPWCSGAGFRRMDLPGGGSFFYEKNPYSEITVLQIAIRGGKRMEGDLDGLAWLSVKMGLEPHSTNSLKEMIQQGTTLTFRVYGDYSLVSLRVLSRHFPKAVELIRKSLFDPLVNSIRLDMIAKTMGHYRDFSADSPDILAYQAQLNAFFSGDPYGHGEYGSEERSGKIRVADIRSFFSQSLSTGNILLAVSSDLPEKELSALLGKMVEKVPQGEPMVLSQARWSLPPTEPVRIKKERVQTLISTAWLLPAQNSKQRICGHLLKTLLSDGVGSKFWSLRSEKNLIYSSHADLTTFQGLTLLMITLRCEDSRKDEVVQAMNGIVKELQERGIDDETFRATRATAQTTFYRDSENKEEKCYWAIAQHLLGMEDDFLSRFETVAAEVRLEEFNRFLGEQLAPEKQSLVLVGPADGK